MSPAAASKHTHYRTLLRRRDNLQGFNRGGSNDRSLFVFLPDGCSTGTHFWCLWPLVGRLDLLHRADGSILVCRTVRELPNPSRSRSDKPSRAVPWSTRAVILLALTINLLPAGERLTSRSCESSVQVALGEGQLWAAWLMVPHVAPIIVPEVWSACQRVPDGSARSALARASIRPAWRYTMAGLGFAIVPQGPPSDRS